MNKYDISLLNDLLPFNITNIERRIFPKELCNSFSYNKDFKLFFSILNTNFVTFLYFIIGRDWYGNYLQLYIAYKDGGTKVKRVYADGSERSVSVANYTFDIDDAVELCNIFNRKVIAKKRLPNCHLEMYRLHYIDDPWIEKDIFHTVADFPQYMGVIKTILSVPLAGVIYCVRKTNLLDNLSNGNELTLKSEHFNDYDSNAISVWHGNVKLGYIPKDHNKLINNALMMHDERIKCFLVERVNLSTCYSNNYTSGKDIKSFLVTIVLTNQVY